MCCIHGPVGVAVGEEVILRSLEWPECHNLHELSLYMVDSYLCLEEARALEGRMGGGC